MTIRTCPRCECRTERTDCCGIDLTVRRKPWRMTAEHVRFVHVLARSRKGLGEEDYRLRLQAVGVTSSKLLGRETFDEFVRGLASLPDSPAWLERQQSRSFGKHSSRPARAAA